MKVRDLLRALLEGKASPDDLDVVILHCGQQAPALEAKVMGRCEAVVLDDGTIEITDEARANSTFSLCIMVEGWDKHHD